MKIKLQLLLFGFFLLLAPALRAQTSPRLYGLTSAYSWDSIGTIFKINGDGGGFSTPHIFSNDLGATPFGSLMQANNGKLYGMTYQGGGDSTVNFPEGTGVIFSFNPADSVFSVIHNFDSIQGAQPFGSLIQASDNKLYGMTSEGGSANLGVIFSMNPDGSEYKSWVDFDGTNGYFPQGSLMQASNGLFYGMTSGDGGAGNYFGEIFSYAAGASSVTTLWNFNGNDTTNAAYPQYGHLTELNGKLYGLAQGGGAKGYGVIFSIDLSGANYKQWGFDGFYDPNHSLPHGDAVGGGAFPYGSLTKIGSLLYGMTQAGGITHNSPLEIGYGTIFSFNPASDSITYLHKFDTKQKGGDGFSPYGDVTYASDGNLYGMTLYSNRLFSNGIVFTINPNGSGYAILHDFGDGINNPANPYGSFIELNAGSITKSATVPPVNNQWNIYPVPFADDLFISSKSAWQKAQRIEVCDLLGRTMFAKNYEGTTDNSIEIKLNGLSEGMYYIKIFTGKENYVQSIIKQ